MLRLSGCQGNRSRQRDDHIRKIGAYPPIQVQKEKLASRLSPEKAVMRRNSRREFQERSGVLFALSLFERRSRSHEKLVTDPEIDPGAFAIRLKQDGHRGKTHHANIPPRRSRNCFPETSPNRHAGPKRLWRLGLGQYTPSESLDRSSAYRCAIDRSCKRSPVYGRFPTGKTRSH